MKERYHDRESHADHREAIPSKSGFGMAQTLEAEDKEYRGYKVREGEKISV
jgi:hypothetical protein